MRSGYTHAWVARHRVVAETRIEHSEENALSAKVHAWLGIVRRM